MTTQSEKDTSQSRGSAASYIEMIKEWQVANGGFRRSPPKAFHKRLNNWVQRCRFDYRNGALSKPVGDALRGLGIVSDDLPNGGHATQGEYERAGWAIGLIKEAGAETDLGRLADVLATTPKLEKWFDEMRKLAWNSPKSLLLGDLREMMPVVFAAEIESSMGEVKTFRSNVDKEAEPIEEACRCMKRKGKLPDILSTDSRERRLGSWVIRLEHGLLGTPIDETKLDDEKRECLRLIREGISTADRNQREAQWRWWSSVAMEVMRSKAAGPDWEMHIHKREPAEHAKALGLQMSAVNKAKQGWAGGAWGVDKACVQLSIALTDSTDEVAEDKPKLETKAQALAIH